MNYRSCQTLVDFTKRAGYDPGLHAHHAGPPAGPARRRIPDGAARRLARIAALDARLGGAPRPETPAACFIYEDEVAGQANAFEADAVAALLRLLYGRVDRQLAGELDEDGTGRSR